MEEYINKPLTTAQAFTNAGMNPPPPQLIMTSHPPPPVVSGSHPQPHASVAQGKKTH